MSAPVQPASSATSQNEVLPSAAALVTAAKLAIQLDKPIQLDYYADSVNGKAFIGEDNSDPKLKVLVKSRDEFTSTIQKLYKASETDCIIMTENTIYIASVKIAKKKINLAALQGDE